MQDAGNRQREDTNKSHFPRMADRNVYSSSKMDLEVVLTGGPPWGFRIQGGTDTDQPVRVSKINPGSKAAKQGVQEGDLVESLNGHSTAQLRNGEAHKLIRSAFDRLHISLRRERKKKGKSREDSDGAMYRTSTCIEINSPTTAGVPSTSNGDGALQSPHSTTLILNPIKTGIKQVGRERSREEVVVDAEDSKLDSNVGENVNPARQDVSEDFGTCIITTPLEPTPVTILDDPSKSEKKAEKHSERPALVSTKSGERRTKAEGVWSPGSSPASTPPTQIKAAIFRENTQESTDTVTLTPVWKPSSPGKSPDINKPEFKSVKLEAASQVNHNSIPKAQENGNGVNNVYPPPASFANSSSTGTASEERGTVSRGERNPPAIPPKTLSLKRSTSADHNQPIYANVHVSLESTPPAFTRINPTGSGLPPSQNPTVTLLQKAREGRIPAKEAVYIDHKMNAREDYQPYSPFSNNENVSKNRWINDQFVVKSEEYLDDRKVTHLEPVKFDGIGPTIRGVPVSLCTGVKDENKAEWYKRMYKSLHRATEPEEEYEVVKYRKRGRPYLGRGGYVSEPEPERIEQYGGRRYGTLDRRKHRNEYYIYSSDIYKNQPKRIEDYEPGHSSIAEMEAKMDDNSDQQGNRQNDVPLYRPPPQDRPFFIKDGYESDSTLVYHKRGPPDSLSPAEQRAWYLEFQKGGDIPLAGFRRPAPDRPEDPPQRYKEGEVNIHYRSPVRNVEKDYVSDEEIRRKQEWMMKQFYEEERRKKTLQEMADIENRRHTDNFVPSQKSPIPLDRYDHLYEDNSISPVLLRTPEPKTAGKALHSFRALTARELSFNKGDIIIINRKIDKNWYEGEHHGHIGIFPVNHVEIIPYDSVRVTTKKASEGQGRVKYNFQAQTNLELSLVKGETVILTRKVDRNWYEGRIGSIKGIFPSSYVDVLIEPGKQESQVTKPVASPVSHSLIKNGNSHVSPKPLSEPAYNQSNYYNQTSSSNYVDASRRYGNSNKSAADRLFDNRKMPLDQTLHIQTQNEPIRYRAIYNYKPQNDDELELRDGDTVYVMEKCDDGWFVGSSQRTGLFGTFPGNYVERI